MLCSCIRFNGKKMVNKLNELRLLLSKGLCIYRSPIWFMLSEQTVCINILSTQDLVKKRIFPQNFMRKMCSKFGFAQGPDMYPQVPTNCSDRLVNYNPKYSEFHIHFFNFWIFLRLVSEIGFVLTDVHIEFLEERNLWPQFLHEVVSNAPYAFNTLLYMAWTTKFVYV